ncbi:MAG: cytochrome C [Candidatus Binatia bacterium]|nr:cytochrome C [Candidatus Binatia bacterium]
MRSRSSSFATIAIAVLISSCAAIQTERSLPSTHVMPPAFRSVLDGRPRMLTLDLGGGVWAAYDAKTSSLYKVWRDGVELEGAVYDYRHGPQPRATGPAYVLRAGRTPWRLRVSGELVRPKVRFRGHREDSGAFIVSSDLEHDGVVIPVEERIARLSGDGPAIEWRFHTSDVPSEVTVEYLVELDSLRESPQTDGALQDVRADSGADFRARLVLASNADTVLRARFGEPRIEASAVPEIDAGWQKLEASGCPSCHATEARTVGPPFVEIAEKYDADDETIERLGAKVRSGGSGVWGETVMPANDFLDPVEAEDLVTFILALDGNDAAARRAAGERLTEGTQPSLWVLAVTHGPGLIADWFGSTVGGWFEPSGKQPGDREPLEGLHPSFDREEIRVRDFEPKVGGMDFLSNGDLVISTWDTQGAVYRISGLGGDDAGDARVRRIAWGLAEPLGLRVVDDKIYVLQKHELTRLVDNDGDGVTDEYQTVSNDWESSGNFHEFAFGLVAEPDGFVATLSSGVVPGGDSAPSQPVDRGAVIRISMDGNAERLARGLRTPNGIGTGIDGELFVADNQGAWLPASKIVHVQRDAFYGFRDVDPEGDADRIETPPVVWLPQDDIGNSPTEPVPLDLGPYRGQMIHGDVTHGGIKRVFAERVDGAYQGAVFRFSQGLQAGVNRLRWGPDGKLYVGGIGNPGNWSHSGGQWFGLERLAYNGESTFEMLAMRALPAGFEVEWTEPLAEGAGEDESAYRIRHWSYEPTAAYGGPKVNLETLEVTSVQVSEDRRRVRLEIPGLRPGSVVHLRADPDEIRSESGDSLWTTEAWYTLNRIPAAVR